MLRASLISLFVLPLTATCLLAQANTMTSVTFCYSKS